MVRALRDDRDHQDVPADPGALDELIERHRANGLRIAAELSAVAAPPPRSVAWAAYRILQEALTNAARHGAGSAAVAVRFGHDRVEIDVTNPAPTTAARHKSRDKSRVGIPDKSRAGSRDESRSGSRDESRGEGRDESRAGAGRSRGGSRDESRGEAGTKPRREPDESRGESRDESRAGSRDESRGEGRDESRGGSRDESQNGSREEGRGGHGIVGMRERATLLGGTLHAAGADGQFRLSAVLPHA